MALPVDPKLADLKALYQRADASYTASLAATQQARGKKARARKALFEHIGELGYCPRCELPLGECQCKRRAGRFA
jgi:hypothetical protein